MKNAFIIFTFLLILGIVVVGIFYVSSQNKWICEKGEWQKTGFTIKPMPKDSCSQHQVVDKNDIEVIDFISCLQAGNVVLESYPRQCKTKDDQIYIENIGNELEKQDLIRIENPRPNQEVTSPLTVTGEARGEWFFEAEFPVILTDWDGLIIGEGIATALSEWMVEDFVKFEAKIDFKKPDYKNNGSLILQKSNPSGLAENDDALEVPVLLK